MALQATAWHGLWKLQKDDWFAQLLSVLLLALSNSSYRAVSRTLCILAKTFPL